MTGALPSLAVVKAHQWNEATVSFYVVKRTVNQRRVARYTILMVNIGADVQQKLRESFFARLGTATNAVAYDFNTVDLDGDLLQIPAADTDFQGILDTIAGSEPPPLAHSQEEIFDGSFYIARFDLPNAPPLFAARKTPRGWATKRKWFSTNHLLFSNMQLVMENRASFTVDDYFDFFSFEEMLFIFYKEAFELNLNFRERMKQITAEVLDEFRQLRVFSDTDYMRNFIGDNMRLLRKVSQMKQLGYYRDAEYLAKLKEANAARALGIEYDENDQIVLSHDRVEMVLHLLTNGRLESIINDEIFDVDTKRKVSD
jgi:hypothetical protein